MAVLEKIRVKFGIGITVIIALALLSFIIDPNTLSSVTQSMSSKYDVGEINGKSISYQDFQSEIDTYTVINEMMTGSTVKSDEQQKAIRDQAWQADIDKYLFIKNAKAAGIAVGEEEMLDLTVGDNVSPILAQNFVDENGIFSKDQLAQFVQSAKDDESGRMSKLWDYLQQVIYTQQFYAKYGSLFQNSTITNALQLNNLITENNVTSNVDFVTVPVGYYPDSVAVVSNSEIKKYYASHKKFFKQQNSRDIKYVVFEVVPSEKDIEEANLAFIENYDEFTTTDNMKSFLLKNSDRSLSNYWYKAGELNTVSSQINDYVFSGATAASQVITEGNTFYAVKVMDTKKLPDNIDVRYIQLKADEEVNAETIAKLREGEPMQMTQTYLIQGFEPLFEAKLNTPTVVENPQYGKFLAEVVSTSELVVKKQVAIYEKTALASKDTYNKFYSEANTLATKTAGSLENFEAAVAEDGLFAHPVNQMLEGADKLGTIENTREITRWAFDQKKAGKASNIITVGQNYFFVVACTGVHKEGYTPVAEAAAQIKSVLKMDKMKEIKKAEVAEKIAGLETLEEMAEALGTTVSNKTDIAFASLMTQGNDPAFIGAVSSAEEGVVTGPVAGTYGVYLFKVNSRETGSYFTEDDAKNKDMQISARNAQMMMYVMMQDADVKDNRARFF